jgi:hypothetical protein
MGNFHGNWGSMELTTDIAICKFLNVTTKEAHLITAGMLLGRKALLLAGLVSRSDHPQKTEILSAFNRIRGMSRRDMFAHAYIRSDATTVTFLDRSSGGEFIAKEHTYTLEQFRKHVADFAKAGGEFYAALGLTKEECNEFAKAALSLNRKSKTSPGAPSDSA